MEVSQLLVEDLDGENFSFVPIIDIDDVVKDVQRLVDIQKFGGKITGGPISPVSGVEFRVDFEAVEVAVGDNVVGGNP